VKSKIVEYAGRTFCDDDVFIARDVLDKEYSDKLKNMKLKNRRNGINKMKSEQTLEDIVSAMIELDQNDVKTNFGARDLLILPKGDPKDLDSYALLQRLMVLEEKMRRMENNLNENVAEVILQKDTLNQAVNNIETHDTLLREGLKPSAPTYANLVDTSRGPHVTTNKGKDSRVRQHPTLSGRSTDMHGSTFYSQPSGGARSRVPSLGSRLQTGSQTDSQMVVKNAPGNAAAIIPAPAAEGSDVKNSDTEWTVIGRDGKPVPANEPPSQKRKQRIQGCGQSDTIRGAPPPKRDYFISRVHSETDDDGLKKYISDKGVQNFNITLVSNANAMFKSYKLSVAISEQNKVLCPEMWPFGVCVQKWRVRYSDRSGDEGGRVNTNTPVHGR
jgi:hypothetical protein